MKSLSKSILMVYAMALGTIPLMAKDYTYRTESFESAVFTNAATTVESETGTWTTNKNIASGSAARTGSSSLAVSRKEGFKLPQLTQGVGKLIYYANCNNRTVTVEVSADGSSWTTAESYKESGSQWVKHSVPVNDASVRWIRFSTNSNNQVFIDDVLVTKPDGTDGDGNIVSTSLSLPYFVNDFEHTNFPSSKEEASSAKSFTNDRGEEWIYLNAYGINNKSYIPDGSSRACRLQKNGSYIITPVVSQGVVNLSFHEGRTAKPIRVYTSTDGGETWDFFKEFDTDSFNVISIDERDVNRVKLTNELTKGDLDVDNISLTAFPVGTPPTVTTGEIYAVTASTAKITGSITSPGDKEVTEQGFCWTTSGDPSYTDNTVKAAGSFSATLTGLPSETEIKVRAYALSLAGVGYGETRTFRTADSSVPDVNSTTPKLSDFSDEQHIYYTIEGEITDNGGKTPTEAGAVFSTSSNPTLENGKSVKGRLAGDRFSVNIPLDPETTYHVRAYATNSAGTGYGPDYTVTTGKLDIPAYEHHAYYCDPEGDDTTADGSEEKPFFSLQKAVDLARPGDIIYMNAGTYAYTSRINIGTVGEPNSGMIRLESRGGRAVLDFKKQGLGDNNQGIRLTGSYWHLYGLDIVNAGDNGLLIERNKPSGGEYKDIAARTDEAHDNIVEFCNFIRNQDTGLQMKNLAEYNRVINCDSYYNTDPDNGDADGFAVKISHGTGNYFYGCRAWQNSDDGWDQFIKKEGGFPDDVTTTLEFCWAFENGILENGTVGKGNGNGFKMGSDQGRNNIIMNRCLAFDNLNKNFDQNHNTGNMILNNCAGIAKADANNKSCYVYRLDESVASGHEIRLTNCVSVCNSDDRKTADYAISSVKGTLDHCDLYTSPSDYVSIDASEMKNDRLDDGSLPRTSFLRPTDGNAKFVDAGVTVQPYVGENIHSVGIEFNGSAPDLGYYESDGGASVGSLYIASGADNRLHAAASRSGLLMISVEGASDSDLHHLDIYDTAGNRLGETDFSGASYTTHINAPAGSLLIVRVSRPGFASALKLIVK